jgi:hypothetical protein
VDIQDKAANGRTEKPANNTVPTTARTGQDGGVNLISINLEKRKGGSELDEIKKFNRPICICSYIQSHSEQPHLNRTTAKECLPIQRNRCQKQNKSNILSTLCFKYWQVLEEDHLM